MKIGDLVKMRDPTEKGIGVVIRSMAAPIPLIEIYWSDGSIDRNKPQWIKKIKKS